MGPPCKDGDLTLTLHGRINYIPASHVEVRFEATPIPRIVLCGIVEESLMFGPQLRLKSEISTEIGTQILTLDDTVTNLADAPQEMESLYHINFGPPLLGAGAQFLAPVKRVAPRDLRAAEGNMAGWNAYTGPHEPGYTEQVYLLELFGDQDAITQAILKSPDGKRGALLSFSLRELPFRGKTREAAIRPCKAVSGCPRNLRFRGSTIIRTKTYAKPGFESNWPRFSLWTRHFAEISKPSRSEPDPVIAPTEDRLFTLWFYTDWITPRHALTC